MHLLVGLRTIGNPDKRESDALGTALARLGIEVVRGAPPPDVPLILGGAVRDATAWLGALTDIPAVGAMVWVRDANSLAGGVAWKLLSAGVVDVVVTKDATEAASRIAARLQRRSEVEALVQLPVVRDNLVGTSSAWRRVLRQAVELARFTDASLLITGETGTGKELIARLIHTLDPRPAKGAIVTLDCTTVVPELSGSEFFGHERGAFTSAVAAREGAFALADQGTLFLDEVGELPPALQSGLLRVVQERTYKRVGGNDWKRTEFRLVCATHRELRAEAAQGGFRFDLYHRIASASVHLPPLRERREDIVPLARHFLAESKSDPEAIGFDPEVEEFLVTREYPGNVRELRHLVRRLAKRHVGPGPITVGDIPEADRHEAVQMLQQDWADGDFAFAIRRALAGGVSLSELKDRTAEVAIEIAVHDAGGNLQRAALKLGVTDRALQLRRAAQRNGEPNESPNRLDRSPPVSLEDAPRK
ncbi:MAG TPA: sigma 54-interacting transcriptional regulator [Verrucomicrobiota bacterium]|nr:sigma-54-dependent Fis family transcriptional regulator [Verrucomicrobiales bacterium]HRI13838.1 sigma 54-interacting transcriptional regulator [Verrucomicrobiota bacterium]